MFSRLNMPADLSAQVSGIWNRMPRFKQLAVQCLQSRDVHLCQPAEIDIHLLIRRGHKSLSPSVNY